jgi:hypothetical protein
LAVLDAVATLDIHLAHGDGIGNISMHLGYESIALILLFRQRVQELGTLQHQVVTGRGKRCELPHSTTHVLVVYQLLSPGSRYFFL